MYKHVLIAVDGSDCSLFAARKGVDLAKYVGAHVTLVTISPTWKSIGLSELALGHLEEEYPARAEAFADRLLKSLETLATEQSVPVKSIHKIAPKPYIAILDMASELGADLIVVGSHGRSGAARLLLGSEASKIVTTSKVSVLVARGDD